jgi:hypothetical protein
LNPKHPILLFPLVLVACTSWHVESLSPEQVIAKHPTQVRVTMAAGDQLVIRNPRVVADSIVGTSSHSAGRTPIGAPLSLVRGVATRRVSALKTGALGAGVLAVTVAVLIGRTAECGFYGC